MLAALGVVWLAPELAGHYYHPRVVALTHTVTLGWITLAIMGASYQMIPVVLERPVWSERLARWQLARAHREHRRDGRALLPRHLAGPGLGGRPARRRRRHAPRERGLEHSWPHALGLHGAIGRAGLCRARAHGPVRLDARRGPSLEVSAGRVLPHAPRPRAARPARLGRADDPGSGGARLSDVPAGARARNLAKPASALGACRGRAGAS